MKNQLQPHHRRFIPMMKTCALFLVATLLIKLNAAEPNNKTSQATKESVLEFQTENISGTIQAEGNYHGVTRLIDKRSGRQFIDERYSALNFHKLMSVNQVMGQPRRMKRSIKKGPDWMEIKWDVSEDHHGELTARYELHPPNAIELVVALESKRHYAAYEVFLSSYFDKTYLPHIHLKSRGRKPPELVSPTYNDVFKDTLLVFARDGQAARLSIDGRWDPIIQMTPARYYAHALAFVTDPELKTAVALMAKPDHVYAISGRYTESDKGPRQTSYTAFDFSLFGKDVNRGDKSSVRIRLEVIPLQDKNLLAPLKQYQDFLKRTPKQ